MSEITELLERFRRGAEPVAAALTGVAGAEQDHKEDPSRWSIRQIVAHLADTEIVAAERFRMVIAEDNPPVLAFDQNLWAERLDYHKRKPSQSLETFRRIRADNYELLKDLPEDAFQRTAQHTKRGQITLLDMVNIFANHPEKHSRQIMAVRQHYKQAKAAAKA
jgi:hypothetical protein